MAICGWPMRHPSAAVAMRPDSPATGRQLTVIVAYATAGFPLALARTMRSPPCARPDHRPAVNSTRTACLPAGRLRHGRTFGPIPARGSLAELTL